MINSNKEFFKTTGYVYVGSYTYPNYAPGASNISESKGISVYAENENGQLTLIQIMACENPSFLTLNNEQTVLYCVNELGDIETDPKGRVSAYRIEPQTGELTYINTQQSSGNWPCYCVVHSSGKYLLTANYGSGNFVVHSIKADGSLGGITDSLHHAPNGSSADYNRQSSAHPHMILNSPSGNFVFGVDLGTDQILTWRLNEQTGKLNSKDLPVTSTASGTGPRHMVFSKDERFVFVLNELSSSIDVFDFNITRGSLIWKQTVSMLPPDSRLMRPDFDPNNPGKVPSGCNTGGEICIHPSNQFLYASNRGMDSIITYKIDIDSGYLTPLRWTQSGGKTPRGMAIDKHGKYLYVGNQDSNNINVFGLDPNSGLPENNPLNLPISVPTDFAFKTA